MNPRFGQLNWTFIKGSCTVEIENRTKDLLDKTMDHDETQFLRGYVAALQFVLDLEVNQSASPVMGMTEPVLDGLKRP